MPTLRLVLLAAASLGKGRFNGRRQRTRSDSLLVRQRRVLAVVERATESTWIPLVQRVFRFHGAQAPGVLGSTPACRLHIRRPLSTTFGSRERRALLECQAGRYHRAETEEGLRGDLLAAAPAQAPAARMTSDGAESQLKPTPHLPVASILLLRGFYLTTLIAQSEAIVGFSILEPRQMQGQWTLASVVAA